ncbi:hypothetical protein L3Q67_02000 [Saccharothrix sp. AJ9571]|nr:hypothetical protein L3Q67_02000 [Saccharothrix sp. AJ9571]
MDISDLAGDAVSLLTGYASAVLDGVVEKAEEHASQRLFDLIKDRLGRRRVPSEAVGRFCREPRDEEVQRTVVTYLRDEVAEDPQFAAELADAVSAARAEFNPSRISETTNVTASSYGLHNSAVGTNTGRIKGSFNHKTIAGIRAPWLLAIAAIVGLAIVSTASYVIVSINRPVWYTELFGAPEVDNELPAAEVGRGTYSERELLQPNPYRAVQLVYQQVAQNRPDLACNNMDEATRNQFAKNLGFRDCQEAVRELSMLVSNRTEYAESMPFNLPGELPGDVVTISSCAYQIKGGGRPLGTFTVTRQRVDETGSPVPGEQWLITAHNNEPCTTPQ